MALSRRGLIGGGLAGLLASLLPRSAQAAEDLRLVFFWFAGGWDTTYIFDPHFGSGVIDGDATASLASVGDLSWADSPERPSVSSVFQSYGDRALIVNGISVGSISHQACARRVLTGSRKVDGADLCARYAARAGGQDLVPYLGLGGQSLPGAHGSKLLLDSELSAQLLRDSGANAREEAVHAYLSGLEVGSQPRRQDWASSLARLPGLQEAAEVFDPPVGPDEAVQVSKALAVLDAGLARCVMLEPTVPTLTQLDSHIDNHGNQTRALEQGFSELKQLLDGLEASGSLDRTLVVVASEMGRTPVLNGGMGKDHWPYTSALVLGGGVQGGRVLGGTDDTLSGRGVDRATGQLDDSASHFAAADFVGSLLQHLGVDAQEELPGCEPLESL